MRKKKAKGLRRRKLPECMAQYDVNVKVVFMESWILARAIHSGLEIFRNIDLETIQNEFIKKDLD